MLIFFQAESQIEESKSRSSQTPGSENEQLVNTRLSSRELYRLSRSIAVDWENLAGLLDIPAEDRNIIRSNNKYHDDRSRAEKMLSFFNRSKDFSRKKLASCLKEIERLDLVEPMSNGKWRSL